MRKKNLIVLLVVGTLMGAMLTGCGQSSETIENDMTVETTEAPSKEEGIGMVEQMTGGDKETPDKSEAPTEAPTEVVEPTEAPTEAPTPEPTATPEPTEAPVVEEVKADWFAENGYTINGQGEFSFNGLANRYNADGSKVPENFVINGTSAISEVDNGDGTKTVTAVISTACVKDEIGWSGRLGIWFAADRYTGTAFVNNEANQDENFTVTLEDGTVVNLVINVTKEKATSADDMVVETIVATVPADYDGLVFALASTKGFSASGAMSVADITLYNEACEFAFFAE